MKKLIIVAFAAAVLTGCTSQQSRADLKPSAWSNPKTYLAEFPLGLRQSELYAQIGAPSATVRLGEAEIWTYRVTANELGPRYEFEIVGGAVRNVIYRTSMGMYDGLSAQEARKK